MQDLISFFDFAMDILCMMPPLDDIEAITLSRDQAIFVSLVAIGFLVFAIMISASKKAFPGNRGVAIIMAICIFVIGFIGLEIEILKGLFLACYPVMVICLRFGEGAIMGSRVSRYLRWWHFILLLGFIAILYYFLKTLRIDNLAFVKGGWALFGAGLAAFIWTRKLTGESIFQDTLSIIAVFIVFMSTLVYVSTSTFERSFYQWSLPIGFIVGIVRTHLSPHKAKTPGYFEPEIEDIQ